MKRDGLGGATVTEGDTNPENRRATHVGPALIVALDCARPGARPERFPLLGVASLSIGRGELCRLTETHLELPDRWMSGQHATLESSFGRWILRDNASKNGVLVNGKRITEAQLADGDWIELGHTFLLFRSNVELDERAEITGLCTLVPALAESFSQLLRVAPTNLPVVLFGPTGCGKEVIARAIHAHSGRVGAFVAVNCGALPASLVEGMLFGHKRGAFSGATEDQIGLVQAADRGTLFLDEIAELPAPAQATLLRVLQEREVLPIGATRPVPVDFRVISASHGDLDARVASGAFREDLYARLSGFRVTVPPLSERKEDLGYLIGVLLERIHEGRPVPGLEPEAARRLFAYDFPQNIRQLDNILRAATALAGMAPIGAEHLPNLERRTVAAPVETLSAEDQAIKDRLIATLKECDGNVSAAARTLNKDRKQIQRWMRRFGL